MMHMMRTVYLKRRTGRPLTRGLCLLILLVMGWAPLHAQSTPATLTGKVVEAEDESKPIEFATVQVLPQAVGVVTNSKGEFTFNRLAPGRVNVKVDFLGMEPIDTTFTLTPGSHNDIVFRMQESTFRLVEVTVVAKEGKREMPPLPSCRDRR